MKATFVCEGSRTRLVGEWTLKPYWPSIGVFEAHFQAAGSGTEMGGLLFRYQDQDEFLVDGSMTEFVGALTPTA